MFGRRERQRLEAALAAEQDRVAQLMKLLMAVKAPAPFAAYVAEPIPDPAEWVWDETGLIGYPASQLSPEDE